jgi:hypothetical protein
MSIAEEIRKYAQDHYVRPALLRGDESVQIKAGDVHNALKLRSQHPNVCQALGSKIFLKNNNLLLESKEGPASGQSSSVVFTYRLPKSQLSKATQTTSQSKYKNPAILELLKLRGIGKKTFAALGGGEEFIRKERELFNEGMLKRERGLI